MLSVVEQFFWATGHANVSAMRFSPASLTDRQIWTLALFLKHMDKLTPAAQAEWNKVHN